MMLMTITRMTNDGGDNDDDDYWYFGSLTCPESSDEHVHKNFIVTIR